MKMACLNREMGAGTKTLLRFFCTFARERLTHRRKNGMMVLSL